MGDAGAASNDAVANGSSAEFCKLTGAMFDNMDADKSGTIDTAEAIAFWGKKFAKINAKAMFNEVDTDGDGMVTIHEWRAFWKNVLTHGYTEAEVMEEIKSMLDGGSWVDWNDGRST